MKRSRPFLRTLLLMTLAATLALAPAPTAWAQDDDDARFKAVVGEAMKAYTEENFDLAIEKFFEAKLIIDAPELVYNIARAYDKMGRCSTAKKHYKQFLSRNDAPEELAGKAKGYIEDLGECPTTGTLVLTCSPADARVQIDGQTAAPCGELTLEQGAHTLVISAPGYIPTDKQISVEAGETLATTVALQIEPAAVAPPDTGSDFNWLGFGLVSGGAALIIGAVVVDVINQENLDQLDRLALDDPDRGSFEDALSTNQALIWTLGGLGVAALGTGTVLWILGIGNGSDDANDTRADGLQWQLTPSATAQGFGGSLRLDF